MGTFNNNLNALYEEHNKSLKHKPMTETRETDLGQLPGEFFYSSSKWKSNTTEVLSGFSYRGL